MHHLFSKHYESWVQISDPYSKYFVRVWQDGLYTGTHPEWTFCPFSIPTLAKVWRVFEAPSSGSDYAKRQRKAIVSIARRRISKLDTSVFGSTPNSNSENEWRKYFSITESDTLRYRNQLFSILVDLHDRLTPIIAYEDYEDIERFSAEYAVDSMRIGYSPRELYVRAGSGIIDPAGLKATQPYKDRIAGLLEHLKQQSCKDFIVVTELTIPGVPISEGLKRKVAPAELANTHDWQSGSGLVRINNRLMAITRCVSTHSITAFHQHRFECKRILRERLSVLRRANIRLSDSVTVFLVDDPGGKGWKHTHPKTHLVNHFRKLESSLDATAFVDAMESSEDEPQIAIRILCDALDRLAGKNWPEVCAAMYTKHLRRELRRRLVIGIRVAQDRPVEKLSQPTWLQCVSDNEETIDFTRLATEIRKDKIHCDELFAKRIEAVADRNLSFSTQYDIRDFLEIARGIRNSQIHSVDWPSHLMHVACYLAKVLLVLFDLLSYESNRGEA